MTTAISQGTRLAVNIADFVVALEIDDDALASRIASRYRQFLDSGDAPLLTVAVRAAPDARYLPITEGNWVIESSLEGGRLHYRSYQEQGEVDLSGRSGVLEMAPTADIENFLRVVYAHLCLEHDALLLHAGGLLRQADGAGYVFFGPSGAGKTTTTTLSADEGTILSDDLVIIRLTSNGSRLYGVPFRGELVDAPRANRQAPLRGAFRLHQASRHAVEPLSPAVAVAELAAAAPFAVGEPSLRARLLDTCARLAQQTPVLNLYFRKDLGFWKAIDEHFATLSQATPANGGARY